MCELFTWTLCGGGGGGAYEKVESLDGAREAGMDASAAGKSCLSLACVSERSVPRFASSACPYKPVNSRGCVCVYLKQKLSHRVELRLSKLKRFVHCNNSFITHKLCTTN